MTTRESLPDNPEPRLSGRAPTASDLVRAHLAADEAEWRALYFTQREIVRASLDALAVLLGERERLLAQRAALTEQVRALMAASS